MNKLNILPGPVAFAERVSWSPTAGDSTMFKTDVDHLKCCGVWSNLDFMWLINQFLWVHLLITNAALPPKQNHTVYC